MLTEEEIQEIGVEVSHYDQKRAACIEALKIVQRHRRWVNDESLRDIAALLGMSPDELDNVATFYNLIYRQPVGRHVIHVCNSVSCWIMGYAAVRARLSEKLGVPLGGTSADDRFTLLPIQCLGTCDHAPALMIDEDLYRDLTPEQIDGVLAKYQ